MTPKQNRMKNSISGRLKKPKVNPLKKPKADTGGPTEGKSRRQPIRFECSIRRRRINWRPSGRKGSGRGANTATTRELRKVARADKSIERLEERERGVKLGEAGAKIWKSRRNLQLSLRGSVEIQAQHCVGDKAVNAQV